VLTHADLRTTKVGSFGPQKPENRETEAGGDVSTLDALLASVLDEASKGAL